MISLMVAILQFSFFRLQINILLFIEIILLE